MAKILAKKMITGTDIEIEKAGFSSLAKFHIELGKYSRARQQGIPDEEYWKSHKLTDEQANLIMTVSRQAELKRRMAAEGITIK